MTKAAYCDKELCLALWKKGIEAHHVLHFEKGGRIYMEKGIDKSTERALEAYPKDIEEFVDVNGVKSVVDNNSWQRTIFLKGYHQAEKDLKLTWKDVNTIIGLYNNLDDNILCNPERACKEILKQFKEMKEK